MKGSETEVKLLSLKAHTQYNNGLQRPAKPNVGDLLLLAGGSQRLASRRKTKSQVTSVSLPIPTISQEKYLEKKSILNQLGSSSKIEN